jgi:hypothetical protein
MITGGVNNASTYNGAEMLTVTLDFVANFLKYTIAIVGKIKVSEKRAVR